MTDDWTKQQAEVCRRHGTELLETPPSGMVGVARNVRSGLLPLNGLRHRPEGGTAGWYVWAGEELSSAPDFFEPVHAEHLAQWRPEVIPFLGLPPGWRFLLAPGHEDVWADPSLLAK